MRRIQFSASSSTTHAPTGNAALAGRAKPHLRQALDCRLAVLGYARQPTIPTKDPELAAAIATSSSLLTRLDGDLFAI